MSRVKTNGAMLQCLGKSAYNISAFKSVFIDVFVSWQAALQMRKWVSFFLRILFRQDSSKSQCTVAIKYDSFHVKTSECICWSELANNSFEKVSLWKCSDTPVPKKYILWLLLLIINTIIIIICVHDKNFVLILNIPISQKIRFW